MSKDTPEPAPREDGTVRQPWDDIVDAGWGPQFAAGNVLRYLRRDPALKGGERERNLRHARWYRDHLLEMAPVKYGIIALRCVESIAPKILQIGDSLFRRAENFVSPDVAVWTDDREAVSATTEARNFCASLSPNE